MSLDKNNMVATQSEPTESAALSQEQERELNALREMSEEEVQEQLAKAQAAQDAEDKAKFEKRLALILKKYEANIKSCIPILQKPIEREVNELLIEMKAEGIVPKNSQNGEPVTKVKIRTFRGKVALIPV